MLGSYICHQCKIRLAPRAVPLRNLRTPQWQPRATFISLRNANPSPPDANADADAQDQQQDARADNHNRPRTRNVPEDELQNIQPQRPGRYSRHVRDSPDRQSSGPVPAVKHHSHQNQHQDRRQDQQQQQEHQRQDQRQVTSYTAPIVKALRTQGIQTAWELFDKTYTSKDCEALTADPSFTDMAQLNNGRMITSLLSSANKAFCDSTGDAVLTPTAVLFKYEQLGIGRPELWYTQTMTYLTHQIILAVSGSSEAMQRDLPSLLFELISVWRLFFQCMGPNNDPLESISTEWHLPTSEFLRQHMHESRDFNYRMQEYHPKCIGNPTLGFCAVYVFNLSEALSSVEALQKQAEPFVQFLTHLLAGSRVNSIFKHTEQSALFKTLPEELRKEIANELDNTPRKAMAIIGSSPAPQNQKDAGDEESTGDATTDLESFHLKRIARATQSKSSATILNGLWTQVEQAYTPTGGKPAIPSRLYNAFLTGFMTLHQSQRCVEVWNHMISHGLQPDEQTWVALLNGCTKGRDLNGFNAMWQRMLKTGVEPDNYMWTTRIHGLMSLRQVNECLKALDEMGNKWRSAEDAVQNPRPHKKGAKRLPASSKPVNNCTKPSIEVINGALSALVQIPRTSMRQEKCIDFAQKILVWSRNFDIKPDAVTFNTLIQLYLQVGDHATGFKILGQMEKEGVEADLATHTMLISAAFDNQMFDDLSHAEQTTRLIQLFSELESGGLRLNAYVYSTAIDRLLKQYSNHTAVRTIIDHMKARNLVPSVHIYTSLIGHYFAQEPPAIEAVDTLVHQIFTSDRVPTDALLFERIIQGYAASGDVGKMMSVLTRMSKHGNLPAWRPLLTIVRALVEAGELDRARFIVRDCKRGEGVALGGIKGGVSLEQQFFYEADKLGVGLEENRMGDFMRMDGQTVAQEEQYHEQRVEDSKSEPEP